MSETLSSAADVINELTLILLFFWGVQKMSSAYYVCSICSNALLTNFIMKANTENPDQTAPKEQSDLGSYCLQYRPPKYISRRESRRQLS